VTSKLVLEIADVIQIGSRNMQNYPLLTEVGRCPAPVLLKRGLSATIDELLMAAEYILKEGNEAVILCERGIRTFDCDHRRSTLDLMAIPILKQLTHLPVIVDPSHAAGRRDLVLPLSLAAAAAAPTGSSSRSTRIRRRRSATVLSSLSPGSSPTTCSACGQRSRSPARASAPTR